MVNKWRMIVKQQVILWEYFIKLLTIYLSVLNQFISLMVNHQLLKKGLEGLGFKFLVKEGFRLPMLNSVILPDGVDDAKIRTQLLQEYNIEVGGGLGDLAGKIWRVGLMGESSSPNHVNTLLSALKKVI